MGYERGLINPKRKLEEKVFLLFIFHAYWPAQQSQPPRCEPHGLPRLFRGLRNLGGCTAGRGVGLSQIGLVAACRRLIGTSVSVGALWRWGIAWNWAGS